ncbi:MAG: hypothetical protein IJI60_02040 [Bacilli bacterium]|nr:hypothetical protein [Bacilli bacterium]
MKCPNCGNKAGRKDIFCEICGTYLKDQEKDDWSAEEIDLEEEEKEEENKVQEEIEKEPIAEEGKEEKKSKKKEKLFSVKDSSGTRKNQYSYENEDLLEAYIGEDYKLIKKSFFNIWAFLFNWMYVLYRKLYVTGIIGLVISWVVIAFFRRYIWIYLAVVSVLLALLFSPYYIFISKKKVEKIKSQNEDEDSFTLSGICKNKGGVRVLPALLLYSAFLIIVFFTITHLRFTFGIRTKFWEENRDNLANCTSLVKVVYRNVSSSGREVGDVTEAVCKITAGDTKEYEVYVKSKKDKDVLYSYYKTQDGYIAYRGDTIMLNELLERQKKVTLTEEEMKMLKELQSMDVNYDKYHDQAEREDLLVKQRKNTREKLSYILNKEEIIR